MTEPAARLPWNVASLLWGIALLALALGGLVATATPAGVLGILLLGHGLTFLALAIDIYSKNQNRKPPDVGLVTGVLSVFLAIELAGLVVARREGEANQALWFAAASSFAIAGMLLCRRGGASDGTITAQLLFHGNLIVPVLGAMVSLGMNALGASESAKAVFTAGPVAKLAFVIAGVFLPIVLLMILAALAHAYSRPAENFSRVWTVLLVHEAAFVLLAARWIFDGV